MIKTINYGLYKELAGYEQVGETGIDFQVEDDVGLVVDDLDGGVVGNRVEERAVQKKVEAVTKLRMDIDLGWEDKWIVFGSLVKNKQMAGGLFRYESEAGELQRFGYNIAMRVYKITDKMTAPKASSIYTYKCRDLGPLSKSCSIGIGLS